MTTDSRIQRALLSVSDKTHLVELAKGLAGKDIEIISTGGSAKLLREHNIPVMDVSDVTGFPEMMDGRVKTLHPLIHGGILNRRAQDQHAIEQHNITPIDLVVVNLYPFEQTIAKPDCTLDEAIENIDIGGPTLIRAAAKNVKYVTVVVDPNDYDDILAELDSKNSAITEDTRFKLAKKAFSHTAKYDAAISNYLNPDMLSLQFTKQQDLRYGENPHQQATFYREHAIEPGSIASAKQLQGKPLSFNNINDTDAALECVKGVSKDQACVIVKHANPCGVAIANTQVEAYQRAFKTDSTSAFGGIIAFNQALTADTAKAIIDQQFAEVIIAPQVEDDALTILQAKPNLRVLSCGDWEKEIKKRMSYHTVNGGMLVQDYDNAQLDLNNLKTVTKRQPPDNEMQDLLFAWRVVKHVKSNAIVYAKDQATIGIGAGQMSRVVSATIAGLKATDAGLEVPGSVMASDAFFPFRDAIDCAAKAGIKAIIQPGGSIRDEEVIQAADEANIAMVFTGMRHFKH